MIIQDLFEEQQSCPHCGGPMFSEMLMMEKKDACYYKVKASAKVWPSAYASGRLVQCRKKGAGNYGNKSEGKINEFAPPGGDDRGPNDEEILRRLAAQWWSGTEQQMIKAQQTLEALGWEIGPDESGNDDAGVYVYRIGDNDGRDTLAFGHSELSLAEGVAEEYELAGVGVAYELGRRAYKQGMTIRDNPYSATREARKNDEWAKGLERGKHDANDARHFRSSVREQGVAEDQLDEKSTSQAQFRTMAAAAHNPEFAKKVGIKQSVAKEFNQADKGSNYKKLPDRTNEGGDVFMANIKDTPEYKAGFATGKLPVPHPEGTQQYASYYKGVIDKASPTLNKVGEGEQQKGADYRDPPEADYGDDYQDMVARVKKLAGLGPLKTVYDPAKRVYRNVPTAVQPKK